MLFSVFIDVEVKVDLKDILANAACWATIQKFKHWHHHLVFGYWGLFLEAWGGVRGQGGKDTKSDLAQLVMLVGRGVTVHKIHGLIRFWGYGSLCFRYSRENNPK